ncbi:FecCD family ABC transporter permease [Plantibacter sp. YIM 135347]|uniref:FecCD family ABC transporter permease n=1 Tax=Plantibacter sp. YIM 135347 TaxID=3423919 RepID=UPI003D34C8D3
MSLTREPTVRRSITRHRRRREIIVVLGLITVIVAIATFALLTGPFAADPRAVLAALFGGGDSATRTVVLTLRLPRIVAAVAFGAGLAVSGALFQSLTRNPLGSPDVVGFTSGAYTGALVAIVVVGGGVGATLIGSVLGGVLAAVLVAGLAAGGHGGRTRLIVVGIGIGAMFTAANHWLILTADLDTALAAAVWGAGSLNGLTWAQVVPTATIVAVLIVIAALGANRMRLLEMGDDLAIALGVRVGRTKLMIVAVGIALTAAVTAVAGPIAFIALVAPHLTKRLLPDRTPLVTTALMGSVLLLASDTVATRLFSPVQLPAGMITICLGGAYLLWLLGRQARQR